MLVNTTYRLAGEHSQGDLAMVHYDSTLTDDYCGTSVAHHSLKDVEVHCLKWRREEGGRRGRMVSSSVVDTNPRLAWWWVLAEMVCT